MNNVFGSDASYIEYMMDESWEDQMYDRNSISFRADFKKSVAHLI